MYRRIDLGIAVGLFALGIAVVVVAAVTIPVSAAAYTFDPVGPRGFAFVVGTLTAVLGAILVPNRLLDRRRRAQAAAVGDEDPELGGDDPRYPGSSRQAFTIVAVTFVYALTLTPVGYLIASALHVAACMWIMGARRRSALLVFPVVYAVVTYVLFGVLLNVRIPKGVLAAPLDALNLG